ncbi:MFS transporter [Georgenia faecalis]|uniref:MFS transporter n=1 Tax=Georgenia faecalis TaxID=2483799 RepID=UPI001F498823|nr:MFS transporter [Georgenia faecalis]
MTDRSPVRDSRWPAFAVCLGAGFMTLLDVSIVNVALPSIEASLDASPSDLQWIVAGYTLAFGLVLVPAGRLGDTLGRRRMFLIGLTAFVLASAACGLVTSAPALAVVRLVQGAAAGVLNPQVVGLIQQLFRGPERGRAFGMFGAVVGISTAIGPLLGGALLAVAGEAEGWRAVFLVNVPVGAVLIPLAARLLPRDTRHGGRTPLDVVGLALLGVTVLGIMLPFVLATEGGGLDQAPWQLLAVAAVALVAFVAWERAFERRGRDPILSSALVRTPSFTLGATIGGLYFAGFTSIFLLVTLYLQQGLGLSPLAAGLVQTPFALLGGATAMIGGRLVTRYGRRLVVIGILTTIAGVAATDVAVLHVDGAAAPWVVAACLALAGAGNGFVISPNSTLALEDVRVAQGGTAGATIQTLQRVGTSVGVAATTAVFFTTLAGAGADAAGYGEALAVGLRVTLGIIAVALVVAVLDSLRRRERPPATLPR